MDNAQPTKKTTFRLLFTINLRYEILLQNLKKNGIFSLSEGWKDVVGTSGKYINDWKKTAFRLLFTINLRYEIR